jgi:hypothetical protein
MLKRFITASAIVLCGGIGSAALADGVQFRVTLPAPAGTTVSGRLLVSVIRPASKLAPAVDPNDSPFWDDPQPMFGVDVSGLAADRPVLVGADADHNFEKITELKPGAYRAAARLIAVHESSSWRSDKGNLFSETVSFTVLADKTVTVDIPLTKKTLGKEWPQGELSGGAELVEIRSSLLSDFYKRDVFLRAGVVKPAAFNPQRKYAAVYEVPGFGGDHFGAIGIARQRSASSSRVVLGDDGVLGANSFWIVLDPESPNGHTLFADSANNGPRGRALVEELIPAIEKKYPLAAKPEARLLRGHSSGGWSTLWLSMQYPETFGATWSSSPDPVDFRRLETVDIYSQKSAYWLGGNAPNRDADAWLRLREVPGALLLSNVPDGRDNTASFRQGNRAVMTVKQEAQTEDILGPDNTSGQQWDSWFAVWGPRNEQGHPANLFDPATGVIDHTVAEQYRKYDIANLVRTQPDKYRDVMQKHVRLVVGGADNFFLNEAVTLLKEDVDKLQARAHAGAGYIKIVPGLDHSTIFQSAEVRGFAGEMVEHLRRTGLVVGAEGGK